MGEWPRTRMWHGPGGVTPMPIYDYRCEQCQAEFEKLVLAPAAVTCPGCQGTDVKRLPSRFGISTGGRLLTSLAGGCGGCRASTCAGCTAGR
ncbi:MAG: FmdB family zinc ribbon protein [Dehalococcoidia bacterium]